MVLLLRFLLDLLIAFARPRAVLLAENLLLRQQVIVLRRTRTRPRLRAFDRWLIPTGPPTRSASPRVIAAKRESSP